MAKLTAKSRKKLKKSQFALPAQRAYPVDTRGRAIAAKSYAKIALGKNHISKKMYNTVVAKANRKLGKKK